MRVHLEQHNHLMSSLVRESGPVVLCVQQLSRTHADQSFIGIKEGRRRPNPKEAVVKFAVYAVLLTSDEDFVSYI